jgi:hypothetical protein
MKPPWLLLAFMVAATVAAAACSGRAPPAPPRRVFPVAAPVRARRLRPAPRPELEPLLAALRGTNRVGSVAVGDGGDESTFHRIGTQVLSRADPPLVAWLAADDDPTLRALGLWGAARRGDVDALARHFCDRDLVLVCPWGCACWDTTVGAIAQAFARRPAWLDRPWEDGPEVPSLLGREAARALEVQTTAIDACRSATAESLIRGGPSPSDWTWAPLRQAVPAVPAWMVVKAMARRGDEQATGELARLLGEATLPADARLAAASGLTRRGGAEAEAAIGRAGPFLRGQAAGLPGRFEEELAWRRRVRAWKETERPGDQALGADQLHHALALDLPTSFFGSRTREAERARGQALLRVARHLGDYRECWDQYRHTAYELEWLLGRESPGEPRGLLRATWTPDEEAEIAAQVQAEVAELDADERCRSY